MTLKMIMAAGEDWELGFKGKLPWSLPEDLAYFKQKTLGKSVIMGYNTFLGLPFDNGFPSRSNFVITSAENNISRKDVNFVTHTQMFDIMSQTPQQEYWVIGGSKTYDSFIDVVDEIHLTKVYGSFDHADCFVGQKTREIINTEFSTQSVTLYDKFQIQVLLRDYKNKE